MHPSFWRVGYFVLHTEYKHTASTLPSLPDCSAHSHVRSGVYGGYGAHGTEEKGSELGSPEEVRKREVETPVHYKKTMTVLVLRISEKVDWQDD